jgi:hypothetical protein
MSPQGSISFGSGAGHGDVFILASGHEVGRDDSGGFAGAPGIVLILSSIEPDNGITPIVGELLGALLDQSCVCAMHDGVSTSATANTPTNKNAE